MPTVGGRNLPVNLDPDPAGNVVMRDGLAHVLTTGEQLNAVGSRLMPHAATCTGRGRRRRN